MISEKTLKKHAETLFEHLSDEGPQRQMDIKIIPEYTLPQIYRHFGDIFIRIRLGNRGPSYTAHDIFHHDYVNRYIWGIQGDERVLDLIAEVIILKPTNKSELCAITHRVRRLIGKMGYLKVVQKIGYTYSKNALKEIYGVV